MPIILKNNSITFVDVKVMLKILLRIFLRYLLTILNKKAMYHVRMTSKKSGHSINLYVPDSDFSLFMSACTYRTYSVTVLSHSNMDVDF